MLKSKKMQSGDFMAYIRDKKEERTGYQNGSPFEPVIDTQCDFVMVYRLDESSAERVKAYKDKGYVVHFMTGISWGHYLEYLDGDFDGRQHWDEVQEDRYGNQIIHGPKVPYMVPTVAFADFLSVKLREIVDMGVEAIHVEEPEFWDRAGYSPAFKREYELYYRTPWVAPHESADAKYKCSRLKAYLFTRTIDRLSSSLKEYAKIKYGKDLRFYVPTHSLLNYTQWKIVSPEGKLADIPGVDGCIAQVWTGTSREKNWYNGVYAERTFETAYLEYGVMQELVKGTGRKMWFLHDPIEDNPIFDWDDYRKNYFMIVTASLMHPKVNTYEICPWPSRVFHGKYPKDSADAISIPDDYRTILNNTFNTLGTIENEESKGLRTGILTGDCQLYQRAYPDCEFSEPPAEVTGTVLIDSDELINNFKNKLIACGGNDRELMLKFMETNALPAFYGLAMPLLKNGVPVRPVLLDNVRRYAGYLDDYDVLLMSYEYMKPEFPDVNAAIAEWVKQGGTLIYVGNGFDPFNRIESWWTGKYDTPAEHLFEMLGVAPENDKEIFACGKGTVGIWKENPAKFTFSAEASSAVRDFFAEVLDKSGLEASFGNSITVRRGDYIISAVFDENEDETPASFKGVFADMFARDFKVITEKTVKPGENTLLLDLDTYKDNIIGTSCRVEKFELTGNGAKITVYGPDELNACLRVRVPFEVEKVFADGKECYFESENIGNTVLVCFESKGKRIEIDIDKKEN